MVTKNTKPRVQEKGGAPTLYREEFDDLARMICATTGAKDPELGRILGTLTKSGKTISRQTIYEWKFKHPSFKKKLQEGRNFWDSEELRKEIILASKKQKVKETTKELRKTGEEDDGTPIYEMMTTKIVTKTVQPNAALLAKAVENLMPDEWKSSQNLQITGEVSNKMSFEDKLELAKMMNDQRKEADGNASQED